jgi:hypothetical protein
MVVVDGGVPSVRGRRGRLLFWRRGKGVEFLGLSHAGYSEAGVGHRRCVLVNLSSGYVVVLDFLTSAGGDHRYEWVLNSPLTDFRMDRGRALSPGLSVVASEGGLVEEVKFDRVRMALPLEGRSTWGQERSEGTNLRFVRSGASVAFGVLLMPGGKRRGDVELNVSQSDPRSRYRLVASVCAPGLRHQYALDCRNGSVRPA